MTKAEADILRELAGSINVVRGQQLETNRILKLLASVLADLQSTAEGLRQELAHVRTQRERTERTRALSDQVGMQPIKKPEPEPT